uniref:Uncharacterized protein n=1 Tax=Glossina morsitans morsitans TaxID=37546 RepID=A0A1B0FIF2_GLOMM
MLRPLPLKNAWKKRKCFQTFHMILWEKNTLANSRSKSVLKSLRYRSSGRSKSKSKSKSKSTVDLYQDCGNVATDRPQDHNGQVKVRECVSVFTTTLANPLSMHHSSLSRIHRYYQNVVYCCFLILTHQSTHQSYH